MPYCFFAQRCFMVVGVPARLRMTIDSHIGADQRHQHGNTVFASSASKSCLPKNIPSGSEFSTNPITVPATLPTKFYRLFKP